MFLTEISISNEKAPPRSYVQTKQKTNCKFCFEQRGLWCHKDSIKIDTSEGKFNHIVECSDNFSVIFRGKHSCSHIIQSSFSVLCLSNYFEYRSSLLKKYSYELCTRVNMEIHTCAKNLDIPVLLLTCITRVHMLVAK